MLLCTQPSRKAPGSTLSTASTASGEVPEADRFSTHSLQHVVISRLCLRPLYDFMLRDPPSLVMVADGQVGIWRYTCSQVQHIGWVKAEKEPIILRQLNSIRW